MGSFATLLASLLLIAPGFAATAVFGLTIGNRIREFSAAAVWSLMFTTLTYALLYGLNRALPWVAPDVRTLAAFDQNAAALNVILAARLALWGIAVGCVAAYLAGLLVRGRPFRMGLRLLTGRSPYLDAWSEVFSSVRETGEANVLVTLADGSAYLGLFDTASELPAQRGLILRNVVVFGRDDPRRERGQAFEDRAARVLISGDIAAVYVYSPDFVARAARVSAPPLPMPGEL